MHSISLPNAVPVKINGLGATKDFFLSGYTLMFLEKMESPLKYFLARAKKKIKQN